MLGNVSYLQGRSDLLELEALRPLDAYALTKTVNFFQRNIAHSYEGMHYNKVTRDLQHFVANRKWISGSNFRQKLAKFPVQIGQFLWPTVLAEFSQIFANFVCNQKLIFLTNFVANIFFPPNFLQKLAKFFFFTLNIAN